MIQEKTIKEKWTNKNYSIDNYRLHLLTATFASIITDYICSQCSLCIYLPILKVLEMDWTFWLLSKPTCISVHREPIPPPPLSPAHLRYFFLWSQTLSLLNLVYDAPRPCTIRGASLPDSDNNTVVRAPCKCVKKTTNALKQIVSWQSFREG